MTAPGGVERAFARSAHDRLAEHRHDAEWFAARWAAPDAAVVVVAPDEVAMDGDRLRRVPAGEAPPGERVLLGQSGDQMQLAVIVADIPPDLDPERVRSAGSRLTADEAGLAVHAVGLANWHRTHPRCARCGTPTVVAQAGHVRRCPACEALHFPRTDPAVIMLATDAADRALLGRHPSWAPRRYSTLAGFVEPGETLEDAVRREIAEETAVRVGTVRYAGSQPSPFPSSPMVGFFADAESDEIRVDGSEIADARWFSREELSELVAAQALFLPGIVSISRWLIETWLRGGHQGHDS
ncbi:NAD(+) diphosphatase [soil metagenome]